MTKTITYYYVVNAKGYSVSENYKNKEQAIEKLNKGLKRGWNWQIKSFEKTISQPENWEMAGCKQDSTKVDWGRNWMKN